MCILCALQRVSQVVPAMLPWLVLPLLALWTASQLLPPPLRFEVTPPRLACGLFLVAVLLWYQILMPQLLTWQARRSARLQERRRLLAVELQRLRKSAVRRCRNCLTEYRDQNPSGSKFTCCYCGHVSKRPVFDLPGPPGTPGIIHELIADKGWMCPQDWSGLGHVSWVPSIPRCSPEKSCAGRLLSVAIGNVKWFCGNVGNAKSSGSYVEGKDSSKEGSMAGRTESKCQKAKRKTEEKRQARLERELQEEEERKQREDVFRLIEEQRKLRDEKLEAVKEALRSTASERRKDGRKVSSKKRAERRKEMDRGSSRSNSDVEELDKRVGRENGRKCELEKKIDSERQGCKKLFVESSRKPQSSADTLQGARGSVSKSRYFDQLKGPFLPNSSGSGGANTIRKSTQNAAVPPSRLSKPIGWTAGNARCKLDAHSSGQMPGQLTGDDKNILPANHHPIVIDQPQPNVWKNKMHRLFENSVAVSSYSNAISTAVAPPKSQTMHCDQQPSASDLSKNSHVVQTLPFSSHPYIDCSIGCNLVSLVSQVSPESLPSVEETFHSNMSEEGDLFEDPCYVPDPIELLGPVSESLDHFPMDYGFKTDYCSKSLNAPVVDRASVNRVSSLHIPLSSFEIPRQEHIISKEFPSSLRTDNFQVSPSKGNIANEANIWHMWGPSLTQNPLSLVDGSSSWLLPIENEQSQKVIKPPSFNRASPELIEGRPLPGINSPLITCAAKSQNGDAILDDCLTDNVPWIQKSVFQPLSNDTEKTIPPLKLQETMDGREVSHDSQRVSASGLAFELSWSKEDLAGLVYRGREDGGRVVLLPRPHIGGLIPINSHVHSLWSSG